MESKVTNFVYEFKETKGAGYFEGYGSVFGNIDSYGDMVAKGAFKSTLAQHAAAKTMPKMLLNHGGLASFTGPAPTDLIPVGKWLGMSEDDHGLHTSGQLINLDTESRKRLYGAMKEKTLEGLSIGYRAKDYTRGTKENEPRRTLKAVDLIEVSLVTFPANEAALLSAVKSGRDVRFVEKMLRDVCGFSRSEAKAIIAHGLKGQTLRDAEDGEAEVAALKALADHIRNLS
jgi:Escherichia/Staphylococcus phage prohead protease